MNNARISSAVTTAKELLQKHSAVSDQRMTEIELALNQLIAFVIADLTQTHR